MLNFTRSRLLQGWGVAVLVASAVSAGLGAAPGLPTVALLLGLALAPALILVILWPGQQPPTVADVMRGRDEQPT